MANKIILIRNAYRHDFGGGERFPVFLARELNKRNYKSYIISRNPGLLSFAKSESINTIKGWWWSNQKWNSWRIVLFPVYIVWQLILYTWYLKLFKKIKPNLVHIQSKDDFIAATYAAKKLNIKVIWTDHADLKHIWKNLTVPIKNPIGKWIHRVAKYPSAITVVSNSEKKEVMKNLPEESDVSRKIQVIYNGCADIKENYKKIQKKKDVFTFLIANRLVTAKGIGETIEAFRMFNQKHKNSRLIIAGDGPERTKFTKQAQNIKTIDFIGHQDDPYEVMSVADVFIQPTYHEGFSVVIVEASMMELPIIATSVGGNTEIIKDRETGILVPLRNPLALYTAMEELFSDITLRKHIAKSARNQYLNKFRFDKIVSERFIPLYEIDD